MTHDIAKVSYSQPNHIGAVCPQAESLGPSCPEMAARLKNTASGIGSENQQDNKGDSLALGLVCIMGPRQKNCWNEEEDQKLTSLWSSSFSAAYIGNELGRTKNAVIGRAHRIGLCARKEPIMKMRSNPSKPRPLFPPIYVPQAMKLPENSPAEAQKCPVDAIPLMEAKSHHCRAVVGTDGPPYGLALFCGQQVVEGHSWCDAHLKEYTYNYRR